MKGMFAILKNQIQNIQRIDTIKIILQTNKMKRPQKKKFNTSQLCFNLGKNKSQYLLQIFNIHYSHYKHSSS